MALSSESGLGSQILDFKFLTSCPSNIQYQSINTEFKVNLLGILAPTVLFQRSQNRFSLTLAPEPALSWALGSPSWLWP